jgi:predicted  nucleic acid-binding Zn-ribbon protein
MKVSFGVVLDLLNSGKDSFVTLLVYEKTYGEIKPKIITYSGKTDLNIFPATIEEVQSNLESTIQHLERKIEEKKKELSELVSGFEKAKEFVGGELSRKLSETSFEEMSQVEYNSKRKELEEATKEF